MSDDGRIINFCNGSSRTWEEIVSCIAGANAMRDDLPVDDAARVHEVSHLLAVMTRDGQMVREYASDPRLDRYAPAK
jgi:hypothetical protein